MSSFIKLTLGKYFSLMLFVLKKKKKKLRVLPWTREIFRSGHISAGTPCIAFRTVRRCTNRNWNVLYAFPCRTLKRLPLGGRGDFCIHSTGNNTRPTNVDFLNSHYYCIIAIPNSLIGYNCCTSRDFYGIILIKKKNAH